MTAGEPGGSEPFTWAMRIGDFIAHYRPLGWLVTGTADGHVARLLDAAGRPRTDVAGHPVKAGPCRTLDGLAEAIEARAAEAADTEGLPVTRGRQPFGEDS